MFGPPPEVVLVNRSVFEPALRFAVTVESAQVSQFAVTGKECAADTVEPLTAMSIGRSAVVPLAKCTVRV
jgi:hypothetical protein